MGGADEQLATVDLLTLGSVLRVCEVELVLLDSNGPLARVDSHVHDEALFCTIKTGFAVRGRFMLPLDWCLIGYLHRADEAASWCHGTGLETGSVLTLLPEGTSEFVLGAGTWMTLAMVPLRRFRQVQAASSLGDLGVPGQLAAQLNPGPEHPLRGVYVDLEQRLREGIASLRSVALDDVLASHLGAVLGATRFQHAVSGRGRYTHYQILRRAEDFMHLNLRRNIYMHEICNAAGVSERALRYAFDDMLGISPNRYLSMLRLCTACRNLASADARKSVKSIALSCGLWDLSRFAENYRRVFGELPRDTLMRRGSSTECA